MSDRLKLYVHDQGAVTTESRSYNFRHATVTEVVAWLQEQDAISYERIAAVLNHHLDRLQVFSNLEPDLPIHFGADAVRTMVLDGLGEGSDV